MKYCSTVTIRDYSEFRQTRSGDAAFEVYMLVLKNDSKVSEARSSLKKIWLLFFK